MKRFLVLLLVLSLFAVPASGETLPMFVSLYNLNAVFYNAPKIDETVDPYVFDDMYFFELDDGFQVGCSSSELFSYNPVFVRCELPGRDSDFLAACAAVGKMTLENDADLANFYCILMQKYLFARMENDLQRGTFGDFVLNFGRCQDGYQMILTNSKK